MFLALVSAIIIAGGAAWLVARRRRPRGDAPHRTKMAGRFGAVEIRMRKGACVAAHALAGQRFLAKDAPAFPLPGCTAAQCFCGFGKLSDRRTDGRRLEHGGLSAAMFLANSRRKKRDRRRDIRH
jgi:hypothetical protein